MDAGFVRSRRKLIVLKLETSEEDKPLVQNRSTSLRWEGMRYCAYIQVPRVYVCVTSSNNKAHLV